MTTDEEKFEKAIRFMTPRAAKWAHEVIDSINNLKLNEEGKDAILKWILELLLYSTPYPNRIITHTLATITGHISAGQALGDLDWSKRDRVFEKLKIK